MFSAAASRILRMSATTGNGTLHNYVHITGKYKVFSIHTFYQHFLDILSICFLIKIHNIVLSSKIRLNLSNCSTVEINLTWSLDLINTKNIYIRLIVDPETTDYDTHNNLVGQSQLHLGFLTLFCRRRQSIKFASEYSLEISPWK